MSYRPFIVLRNIFYAPKLGCSQPDTATIRRRVERAFVHTGTARAEPT